jgi:hypothetical protein
MSQCEHDFEVDERDGQVRCKFCQVSDDEMELPNKKQEEKDALDEFYKTQVNFE